MENTNEIKNILSKIKYPGFNRDIVSFGMLKNISFDNSILNIVLSINSDNQDNFKKLKEEIKNKLQHLSFSSINIEILKPETQAPQQTNSGELNQSPIPGIKNIIAIASGKGGVGKSTISINLAATLSKKYKVGLLDLDIYGPSLALLTGLNQQPKIDENKKLIPLEKYNMSLMSFGFINNQNSPAVWRGPMVSRMTQQFFEDVKWGKLDYLILDLPPGTGDIQLTLVQKLALTGAIIITTPQDLALLDVKKGADMFGKVNTPILGVIENMTHFLCPNCNEVSKIFSGSGGQEESTRLNVPLLGKIYLSSDISTSSDQGIPYVLKFPNTPISNEYKKIATDIAEICNNNN